MTKTWIIGTAADCDLQIDSPYVSGRHCRLTEESGRWIIEDLGSTNGTFVNGTKILGPEPVRQTDQITLGTHVPLPWPADQAARGGEPAVLPLPTGPRSVVIGRASDCDIVISLPMVSSRHACLEPDGEDWTIRDLGSTNGTFVRGRRITAAVPVAVGERIGLGSCHLKIVSAGDTLLQTGREGHASAAAVDVAVDAAGRRLIAGVDLTVHRGEVVAIMGPSGAGKSTLLATLAGYQKPSAGEVLVDGADLYDRFDEFRGQIGYVPQDDIMHAELTVGQALWYAARLRLPRDYSDTEIDRRITEVMTQLRLADVAAIRIGSAERRGISGGQRKRVNIALELITDPPLLILDEPTSGLSSTDALVVIRLLRELAARGKSILLSIHQPGLEALQLMDGLAVVARDASTDETGRLVWYGPAHPDAGAFFDPDRNPSDADAVLRGLARRPIREWEKAYRKSPICRQWVDSRRPLAGAGGSPRPHRGPSLLDAASQWWALVRRSVAVKTADRWATGILLVQAPLIAFLVAWVFAGRATTPIDHESWADVSQAVATTTFLMALAAIWFGCSNAAREVVAERAILRRERMTGLSLTAYLIAKVVVLAALAGLQCWLLTVIVATGCGLRANLWTVWTTLLLAANAATAIGLCVSALARSAETAAGILPLVILPMVILGGILLPLPELPAPAASLADLMPSRWAFEAVFVAESDSRPLLEVPVLGEPADPPGTRLEDLADQWFPHERWRSSRQTPAWMLLTTWLLGVVALRGLLRHDDGPG
ncbi:MAG: FHA domain-containing protein [Planctomycetota bacterium]|jgi:ABC-type multidrug transport system ATPase subunit/pSer/pThr/pTyr-binding forkhead associated (FHA) protein/ABC-type multidrug transport system permease subunit|nr:FHA domain-containing protein [Planctomycetota bacterium]MDA1202364.1 FHA domain-containing protein [Planctomycetota bacterium]